MRPVLRAEAHVVGLPAAGAFALLALVVIALYWQGLGGGFIFDDYPNLVDDRNWRLTHLDWQQVRRVGGAGIASTLGRGLALLTFALNHLATGMDPWPMKLTNVLMHVANGALVFALTHRVVRRLHPAATWATSWTVAALWLIHPLQVSTVLYVVQRMEIGAQLGVLVSLLLYMAGRERQCERRPATIHFAGAVVALTVGLGFKETALLTPAFALLLEIFVLRFAGAGGGIDRRWVFAHLAWVLIAATVFCGFVIPRYTAPEAYDGRAFTLYERLLTQARVLCMYVGDAFIPLPERFRFYYDDLRASTGWLSPVTTLVCGVALAGLIGLAAFLRRRRPLMALGIAWFFVAHALTSNIVPLELAFEHRNYMALLGLAWSVADLALLVGRRLSPEAFRVAVGVPLVALAFWCTLNTLTWGEPMRLALALEGRASESPRAAYSVGVAFYRASGDDPAAPGWALARRQFLRASALPQSQILGDQAIILMDARAHRPSDAGAWAALQRKLLARRIRPEEIGALRQLSECSGACACSIDRRALVRTLAIAVSRNPKVPELRAMSAAVLFRAANRSAGLVEARQAVALAPDDPSYRIDLATFLLASQASNSTEIRDLIAVARQQNRHGDVDAKLLRFQGLQNAAARGGRVVASSQESACAGHARHP